MQVFAFAFICAALPATISTVPHVPSSCVDQRTGYAPVVLRQVMQATPQLPFATPGASLTTTASWELPTSRTSTTGSALKEQHPRAPTCGLGGCATKQSTKPLLFNMQVFAFAFICAALPATISTVPHVPSSCVDQRTGYAPVVLRQVMQATPQLPFATPGASLTTTASWELPTSRTSTTGSALKEQHPRAPTCGLGGCATKQSTKPLLFNMQLASSDTIHLGPTPTSFPSYWASLTSNPSTQPHYYLLGLLFLPFID
ncbi:uncharacterized protein LOC119388155 [Rhipicephalus sanguineus]|uniref:uncharacterized protein LOC119388155 n=1 Tax=Rhipicephalus sanguineus TaxID=34632 RepID=UPI00189350ED|nr:uncharacterized protein LOC119388155 [Rhipicephalus sanguineus]